MAQRAFDTNTWSDRWFEDLPPQAKLLFIYLWTNEHCNQAGLYEISTKKMAFETGLDLDQIPELMQTLEPKVVWYPDQGIVWVKNFLRHQSRSNKFVAAATKALQGLNIPDELKAEFEMHNQDLLEGVAPNQDISLTKQECVAIRDNFICQYCGKEINDESDYEMDHILPATRGGKDNYLNLVASCRDCNQRKLGETPIEAGLPEPNASNFHGAQATYLLKTNRTLLEKWLRVFPKRRQAISRVLGNDFNQYQSILDDVDDVDQNSERLSSTSTSTSDPNANANALSVDERGIVKGEVNASDLQMLPGWGNSQIKQDEVWLTEFLQEYPEFGHKHLKGCRDYHSSKNKHTKGQWKNRLRNWMEKEREKARDPPQEQAKRRGYRGEPHPPDDYKKPW